MKTCKDGRIWGQNNKEASSHLGVLSGRKKIVSECRHDRRHDCSEKRKGAGNPFYGKHHSGASRLKISAGNKGKVVSEEAKKKISETQKGRPVSEERRKKISRGNTGKIRSTEVRMKLSLIHKGEKSYRWKGGVTEKNRSIRGSIELRLWREAVFARDNYTCQVCGNYVVYLNAHHIKQFSKYPELRVDISNGVTLCKKCHRKIHFNVGKQEVTS